MTNLNFGSVNPIDLMRDLEQTLRRHFKSHSYDLVFFRKDGAIITPDYLRYHFWKDQKLAGVTRIRFHDVRHSFASHFVMRGGGLYELSTLLGHSGVETAKRYAHLASDYLQKHEGIP